MHLVQGRSCWYKIILVGLVDRYRREVLRGGVFGTMTQSKEILHTRSQVMCCQAHGPCLLARCSTYTHTHKYLLRRRKGPQSTAQAAFPCRVTVELPAARGQEQTVQIFPEYACAQTWTPWIGLTRDVKQANGLTDRRQ
jgi:hypothetical protein